MAVCFFYLYDPETAEIYSYRHTRSRHAALPIGLSHHSGGAGRGVGGGRVADRGGGSGTKREEADLADEPSSYQPCNLLLAYSDGRFVGELFRSEEHTSELQSLMRISTAVFCLKKKQNTTRTNSRQTPRHR